LVDLWQGCGKGGGINQTIASLWGPALMMTNSKAILAFAEVDRSPTGHDGFMLSDHALRGRSGRERSKDGILRMLEFCTTDARRKFEGKWCHAQSG